MEKRNAIIAVAAILILASGTVIYFVKYPLSRQPIPAVPLPGKSAGEEYLSEKDRALTELRAAAEQAELKNPSSFSSPEEKQAALEAIRAAAQKAEELLPTAFASEEERQQALEALKAEMETAEKKALLEKLNETKTGE